MHSRLSTDFSDKDEFLNALELNQNSFDFILCSIESSIANPESIKCLTATENETETIFTKCWHKILNELIYSKQYVISNPFLTFFQSSVSSFYKLNIVSCKTAICLTIIIWKHLKNLVLTGNLCPKKLSHNLNEILENLIERIKNNKLNYLPRSIEVSSKSKFLSRHFNRINESSYNMPKNEEYFKKLILGICRNQTKMSELIWKIIITLESEKFDYNNILIMISTPTKVNLFKSEIKMFNFEVADGIIIKFNSDKFSLVEKLCGLNCLNTLVIDAGLVHDFTHMGFNKKLEFSEFVSSANPMCPSYKNNWLNQIRKTFRECHIQCVFVRDNVDKEILEFCELNSILILHNLSYKLVKMIQDFYNCESILYIEDFRLENLFKCRFHLIKSNKLSNAYLKLDSIGLNEKEKMIVTVLIETRLKNTCDMYKEDLKHCLKRVHNILASGFYLNGNGEIENYIAENIMQGISKKHEEEDDDIYHNLIKEALSKAFRDYNLLISKNDLSKSNYSLDTARTYDDFQSKVEAWKFALMMNKFFFNCDKAFVY